VSGTTFELVESVEVVAALLTSVPPLETALALVCWLVLLLVKLTAELAVDTGVELIARLVAAVEAGMVLLVKSGTELADVVAALAAVEVALTALDTATLVATAEAGILADSADAAPILVVAVVVVLAVVVSAGVVAAFAVIG